MFWYLKKLISPKGKTASRQRVAKRFHLGLEKLESRLAPSVNVSGFGTGLIGNYFSDANLTNLASTRLDSTVNLKATGTSSFGSAQWTGQLQAQASEAYTFYTDSTGGMQLWVDGKEIINNWTNHSLTENSATVTLTAGHLYNIAFLYTGTAVTAGQTQAQLFWSSPSTPKAIIPTAQLYAGGSWLDTSLGTPVPTGSVSSTGPVYVVQGAGTGFGGTSDQGHFLYQTLTGDGTIIAEVNNVQGTDPGAQAGIMVRDVLQANSLSADLVMTPSNGALFQYRGIAGGQSSQVTAAGISGPYWVKLVRDGNVFDGYVSSTGATNTWTLVGTTSIPMGKTVEVGLAVSSLHNGTLNSSTFSNVSIVPTIPLGANLDAVIDYSLGNAFVDMMKQARQFSSLALSTPGHPVAATVDANGWPTEDFGVLFQSGFPGTANVYNGTYHLSFTGQATVATSGTPGGSVINVVYDPLTNTTTADVTLQATNTATYYLILNFRNTIGGVQNIKLIRPGYAANTTQVFTNQFLGTLQSFSTLRFMNWTRTNNNTTVNWSDRSHVTDATQSTTKGVAWEYIIQLANLTHKDLWINIPVNATQDYVIQLATLLQKNLDPDRIVYVEYSNEVWNSQFTQATSNLQAAVAEVQAGMASGTPSNLFNPGETAKNSNGTWVFQNQWALRRIARSIVEISNDFASVWGSAAINNRVRPVYANQFANPWLLQTGLQFIDKTFGAPKQFIYAVAGAPYFTLNGQDTQTNLTVTQIISAMSASIDKQIAGMPQYLDLATYYGLRDMAYEGGPSTFGPNNIANKAAASLDPRMKNLIIKYLDGWYSAGGDLFNWFVAGPTNYNTPYGTWGVTNDITNLNTPKMQGIQAVLAAPKPGLNGVFFLPGQIAATNYVGAQPTTSQYLGSFHNGAFVDYFVQAPLSGTYHLTINYAATMPGEQLQVIVNDQVVQTLTLALTGKGVDSLKSPNQFADAPTITLNLPEGLNVVRLLVVNGSFSIRSLKFS